MIVSYLFKKARISARVFLLWLIDSNISRFSTCSFSLYKHLIQVKFYPGNESKKPVLRDVIDQLKKQNHIVGKTIHVVDKVQSTCNNLWRIEESFKIMKSDLDARPVYLQGEAAIKGHFLICYLTVLLEKLMQFKVLENQYSTNELFDFIKKFNITKAEHKYINTATYTDFIDELGKWNLTLTNYLLTEKQICQYNFPYSALYTVLCIYFCTLLSFKDQKNNTINYLYCFLPFPMYYHPKDAHSFYHYVQISPFLLICT